MKVTRVPFYMGRSHRAQLDFFLLSSSLQKSVRRWMLDDALYYSREFIEAGQINYLFKRLFVMLVEDIWIWNIYLWKYLLEKMKEFEISVKWDEVDETIIYEIIREFCLSPKNREDDYFIVSYYKGLKYDSYLDSLLKKLIVFIWATPFKDDTKNKDIKEILLYINSYKNLYDEPLILKKSENFVNEMFEKKSNKVRDFLKNLLYVEFWAFVDKEIFEVYLEWFLKLNELNWKDWLMLFFTFFELYRRFEIKYDKNKEIPLNKNSNIKFIIDETIKPKDYMYDKHTVKGKALWRGLEHFVREWWLLNNEVVFNNNEYTKLFQNAVANWIIKD